MPQPPTRQPPAKLRQGLEDAVRAARTALLDRAFARGLGIAIAAGVFLAAVGAFGSGSAPLAPRVGYWVGLMIAGSLVAALVSQIVGRRGLADARPWLFGAILSVAITIPLTGLVWAVTNLLFAGRLSLVTLGNFLLPVWVITTAMTALNFLAQRQPPETHAGPPGSAPPRFLERLPLKLRGGDLYAVEAEDHYLRLHTSRGQDLILLRLADAVAELEGVEGAQTHRSWWVAKAAVRAAQRGDGRATLTLEGGAQVPVSRAYAKALRAAGWF